MAGETAACAARSRANLGGGMIGTLISTPNATFGTLPNGTPVSFFPTFLTPSAETQAGMHHIPLLAPHECPCPRVHAHGACVPPFCAARAALLHPFVACVVAFPSHVNLCSTLSLFRLPSPSPLPFLPNTPRALVFSDASCATTAGSEPLSRGSGRSRLLHAVRHAPQSTGRGAADGALAVPAAP